MKSMDKVEVILLERIPKLGLMGALVQVRRGYACNYLLPQKKALRATKENRTYFENNRLMLEARNTERRADAKYIAEKTDKLQVTVIRQGQENGILYGSVSVRDIVQVLQEQGILIERRHIDLDRSIKKIGVYSVPLLLHEDVEASVLLNVARSEEEARNQWQDMQENRKEDDILTQE